MEENPETYDIKIIKIKKKIKKLYEKDVLGIDAALYRLKFLYLNEYQKKKTCVVCTEWWTQPHVECISARKSKR